MAFGRQTAPERGADRLPERDSARNGISPSHEGVGLPDARLHFPALVGQAFSQSFTASGGSGVMGYREAPQRDTDALAFENFLHVADIDVAYTRYAASEIFGELGRSAC